MDCWCNCEAGWAYMLLCWSWPEGDATEAGEFDCGV